MQRLMPYLQLIRLPTVFTAVADIMLGFALTNLTLFEAGLIGDDLPTTLREPWVWELGWLVVTSVCLYLSGMVFNDVFDWRIDAEERPSAPIPSGRVSVFTATILGTVLMCTGLAASYAVGYGKITGQYDPLKMALLLCVAILGYDGLLKKTMAGPLAMGLCRFLNVMLGASAIGLWFSVWTRPQLQIAAGLGVYVLVLTLFARTEDKQSKRLTLVIATLFVNAGLGIVAHLLTYWPGTAEPRNVGFALLVIALVVNRRLAAAIQDPSPGMVQTAVKTMLLSLVVIDATMIYFNTAHAGFAVATVLLLVPSFVLSRWIRLT